MGLPDDKAMRKACNRATAVRIYSYGGQAAAQWRRQLPDAASRNDKLEIFALEAQATRELAALAQRSMRLQITIQDGHALVTDGDRAVEIAPLAV